MTLNEDGVGILLMNEKVKYRAVLVGEAVWRDRYELH